MISINLKGRFGNHLWMYAVCRSIAEYKGYNFHIPRNWLGSEIFSCDLGLDYEETKFIFEDHISQIYNPKIYEIQDFTKLNGFFQSEKYILNNKKNILNWFVTKIKNTSYLDDDTCAIHFRGNDYKSMGDVYLYKKYYYDSIKFLLSINKNIKFCVITDDEQEAAKYFPNFLTIKSSSVNDFNLLNTAKYLIISNSTFSWWAAWLNKRSIITVAPKYWFKHNISNGWWSPADAITTGFLYMDRSGVIHTSNNCIEENLQNFSILNNQDNYTLVDK